MNDKELLSFICRENNKNIIPYLLEDDINIFRKYINIKIIENRNIDKNKSIYIRPMPILILLSTVLTEDEYQYLECLYRLSTQLKGTNKIIKDVDIYTREYLVEHRLRKVQNNLIYRANSKFIHNYDFNKMIYDRLLDGRMYWKMAPINYRFILPDFINNKYGTCLDTSLIISSYYDSKGVYNFIANIRGKKGGHSITVIPSLKKVVSNFELIDIRILKDYLKKFDIDSIIIKGREFFFEDVKNDLDLNKALYCLSEQGNYRFYYSTNKVSIPSYVINRYLAEFE